MQGNNFWNGKKVLITGINGFIGSWTAIRMLEMGACVIGIAKNKSKEESNFYVCHIEKKIALERGDIRDRAFLQEVCKKHQPEIIIHLAGQPIISIAALKPEETNEVNILGTLNILECIRECQSIKACLFVTSSRCYENKGWIEPYSKSVGCASMLIDIYQNNIFSQWGKKDCTPAIIRFVLDNVIGGGDWGESRLIPDCIKAIKENKSIFLKTPNALIHWNSIFDVVEGIMLCIEKSFQQPKEFSKTFGLPRKIEYYKTVYDIASSVVSYYGEGTIECGEKILQESLQKLESPDIGGVCAVRPECERTIEDTLKMTVEWYQNYQSAEMYEFCKNQINVE